MENQLGQDPNSAKLVIESQSDLKVTITKLCPWVSFHGWIYLLGGAFYCLSIIGAIIGVPMIIAGVGLINSTKDFRDFANSQDLARLNSALVEQKKFFATTGILFILTFIVPILLFISLLLTLAFNPQINKSFDSWTNKLPKLQDKVNSDSAEDSDESNNSDDSSDSGKGTDI
jgi:hypothetical protein